jgi:Lon protease-like protein
VNDVLGGDKRFAVFLLKPGQEADYLGSPAPFEVGCLGEIVRAEALEDGRFNVLLMGVARIRIEEFLTEVPYRVIGATLLPERTAPPAESDDQAFRTLLGRYFRTVLNRATGGGVGEQTLETLVNTAAANVETDVLERQRLLEAGSLTDRLERVSELMEEQIVARRAILQARPLRPSDPRLN